MRYFHIQRINGRRKEWRKGEFGKTSQNNFYKEIIRGIEGISKLNTNGKRIIERSRKALSSEWIEKLNFESRDYENLFYKVQDELINFEGISKELFESHLQHLKWIREEIFERNRIEINPNLPSRKKCIWLCTEEGLQSWWKTFENSPKKRIIELKLEDDKKIHIGDAEYLHLDAFSISEWQNLSINYWKGIKTENPDIEILFEGKFEVINEFEQIDTMDNVF